ncbi:MAG: hypothetical protein E7311_03270 [Clostridiales bacterium]|nr:hypothetical protein [Clostridiales bacterium]
MTRVRFVVTSKDSVEERVNEQHETYLEMELKKAKVLVDDALVDIENQMALAKNKGIFYDQADVKLEVDLSDFDEVVRKEVNRAIKSAGWEIYYGVKPGSTIIKPY